MNERRFETTEHVGELLRRLGAESFVVPNDLAARTGSRIARDLRELRWRRKEVVGKLALLGAFSFPLVAASNAALAWVLFEALDGFAPAPLAAAATLSASAFLLLSLSLSYGSLPVLASFGLRLQEETT